jgi:hypothetical protein
VYQLFPAIKAASNVPWGSDRAGARGRPMRYKSMFIIQYFSTLGWLKSLVRHAEDGETPPHRSESGKRPSDHARRPTDAPRGNAVVTSYYSGAAGTMVYARIER